MSILKEEALYNEGIALYEQGDFESAITRFNEAIALDSKNAKYYYNLGLSFVKISNYEEAVRAFNNCLQYNPDDNEAYYNIGIANAEKGDYESAIKAYNKAISINPNDYAPYDSLGSAYYVTDKLQLALENFNKAASKAPSNPSVAYNLAYTYYMQDMLDEAKDAFKKVLKLNPSDEEAAFNLANVYLKQNKYENAKKTYESILARSPENEEAKEHLEKVIKLIESGSTGIEIKEREAKTPGFIPCSDAEIVYLEAQTLLNKKNLIPAIAKFKEAKKLNPKNDRAIDGLNSAFKLLQTSKDLAMQANKFLASKDIGSAIDCYKKSLQLHPFDSEIEEKFSSIKILHAQNSKELKEKSMNLSDQLMYEGNYDKAIDILQAYTSRSPDDSDGHLNLGKAYKMNKEYTSALDSLNKAMLLDSGNIEIQKVLFEVLQIINTVKDEAKDYIQLGLRYIKQNEHNKAFEALKNALQLSNNNPEIEKIVGELTDKIIKEKKSLNSDTCSAVENINESINKYQQLVKENPEDIDAHYNLGVLYAKQLKYDEAMESLKIVIGIEQNHSKAQNLIFDIFKSQNER